MKPISIQLYTVREQAKDGNHLQVLQQIADIGYKGVEGSGYGMSDKEFRKVVNDMGMVVSSCWHELPTPDTLQKVVDHAGDLGTDLVVTGFWIPEFETVDAIKKTAEKLNAALPLFKKAGLTFAMHNHWMEFEPVEGRLAIDWLLDECPDLNLELDIYWCAAFGINKPEEIAAKHRSRIPLLHVKDGTLEKGIPHLAVGGGNVDIKATLEAADPNVLRWHVVELDECGTDMMTAVADSYRYLVGNGFSEGNKPV